MKVVRTSKADPSSAVELRQRKAVLWIGEGAASNAGYTWTVKNSVLQGGVGCATLFLWCRG